jgi:hypothetical protein
LVHAVDASADGFRLSKLSSDVFVPCPQQHSGHVGPSELAKAVSFQQSPLAVYLGVWEGSIAGPLLRASGKAGA